MITICPQCRTGFQITTAQLSARQGLVRCGRCTTVFNGFAALQNSAESTEQQPANTTAAPSPPTEARAMAPAAPIGLTENATLPADSMATSGEPNCAPEEPAHRQGAVPASAMAPQPAEPPSPRSAAAPWPAIEPPQAFPAVYTKAAQAIEAPENESTDQSSATPEHPEEQIDWPPLFLDDDPAGSLFPTAKTPIDPAAEDEWKPQSRPPEEELLEYEPELLLPLPDPTAQRSGWIAIGLLLAVLLVLQGALLVRNDIVATWPEVYPSVRGICLRLGCTVALPRQIDRITIESTELRADPTNPSVIVLTALLRNRTGLMLEYPWLEVSLTDTLDRAVARRSLAPNDYLPKPPRPEEGIPAGSELTVKAAFEAAEAKASGYKLRLYYP